MTRIKPFKISVSDEKLSHISERVAAFRSHPAPIDDNWQYGTKTSVLEDLRQYWLADYDWRKAEADLNTLPHFTAEIDGIDIHFVHVVGEANGKRPLLITHGWPGSFYEFHDVIGPLAYPSRHGGRPEDAFDLIIPSLPGYAFSGKPQKPIGQRTTAGLFNTLMQDVLGYETYIAQGGDWGGLVTSWLGLDHCAPKHGCTAIHLNMIGLSPADKTPQTEAETQWLQHSQAMMQLEGAYLMEQATKPQTLALALMDSPVGQAAWILEKFHGWSDLEAGDLYSVYSRDQLLTNIMLYLVNDAFATSVWYYNGLFAEGGNTLQPEEKVSIPTGIANFPGEKVYSTPPRSWCERIYNVTHWSDMPKGGHFAAMEQPSLFIEEVRKWGRAHS